MNTNLENSILYIFSIGGPTVFLIFVTYFITKMISKERQLLIEKGKEVPPLSSFFTKIMILKIGMFLIGFALGMLAGIFLKGFWGMDEGIAWAITIPLFTGFSLIVSYLIDKDKSE